MANLKVGLDAVVDKNGFIQNYPVGTIIIKNNSTIDSGWLLCDGRYVNTVDYPELYAHIGTTYGALVGSTFRLPPLVYNPTNNTTPRMPFSTISSEATYPSSFLHGHTVGINATNFSAATHTHNHNSNTAGSNNDNHSHNHGQITGNTDASGAGAGSAATRLAGPSGPYASGNSGQVNHTHAGAVNGQGPGAVWGWAGNSTNYFYSHAHNVTIHTQTDHNHNHNTNIASSSHTVSSPAIIPLSKQVYFLIKT
jgi:microcystin-dependent protein